jgi:hypothetical protein
MKPKLFLPLIGLLILSSCVIKSLHPFYTEDTICFEKIFIGSWNATGNGLWKVEPFQKVILKENGKSKPSELNESELTSYKKYKHAYVLYFEKDSNKTTFLAMPFKIDNQMFLDIIPVEDSTSEKSKNGLYKMHLIETHSLAKFDIVSDNEINISWLSSKKLDELLIGNRIKIQHEKVGFGETVILTASSEELVKFIKKYIHSKDKEKWKTDVSFNLTRTHGKN